MNRQDKWRDGKRVSRGIEWTQMYERPGYTWNPTAGCYHGCTWEMPDGSVTECYAKTIAERLASSVYDEGFEHHYWRPHALDGPLREKEPSGIFVGSMADLFGHWVPDDHIQQVLDVMTEADWHIFQTLSKYPIRLKEFEFPANVWAGVSLPAGHRMKREGATRALNVYLRHMVDIKATIRFMSIEPIWFDVAPVFEQWVITHGKLPFEWAIIGAASKGPKVYQPDPDWVADVLDLLDAQNIPVFFKGNLEGNLAADPWREDFPPENYPSLIDSSPASRNLTKLLVYEPQLIENIGKQLQTYLTDASDSRTSQSRLRRFFGWVSQHGGTLIPPDLEGWYHSLKEDGKKASTIQAYVSTVRELYRRQLLKSNAFRDNLFAMLPDEMAYTEQFVRVENLLTQLRNALDPDRIQIPLARIQDEIDSESISLSWDEVRTLILSPGVETLAGLRNTALMALMVCTGIRAGELRDVDVADLREQHDGELGLRIRSDRGHKERLILYGRNDWGLALVEAWLKKAGIKKGPVFARLMTADRLYYDDNGQLSRLSLTSIGNVLRKYKIMYQGRRIQVRSRDLRRTYARALHETGVPLDVIQRNLGHDYMDLTHQYIGSLAGRQRAPRDAFHAGQWIHNLWHELEMTQ